jgi:hypothetical protein
MPYKARKPEPEVKVFELGHYESLQIQQALDIMVRVMSPNGELTGAEIVDDLDIDTIRQMRNLFAGHATLILIRKEESL